MAEIPSLTLREPQLRTASPTLGIQKQGGVVGQVGQALEGLGQATTQAGDVFAQRALQMAAEDNHAAALAASSDASNAMLAQLNADGGFYTLNGKNAVDALPGAMQGLKDTANKFKSNLTNPDSQRLFDQMTSRDIDYFSTSMAQHAASERRKYIAGVHEGAISAAQNQAYFARDVQGFNDALGQVTTAVAGMDADMGVSPQLGAEHNLKVLSETRRNFVTRMISDDAIKAQEVYKDWRDKGLFTPEDDLVLSRAVESAAKPQEAANIGDQVLNEVLHGTQSAGLGAPGVAERFTGHGATPGEAADAARIAQIESGGRMVQGPGSHQGTFQFDQSTFNRALPGGDISKAEDQDQAFLNLYRDNIKVLKAHGLEADGANAYLMHQQGSGEKGGGIKLIEAPANTPATSVVSLDAIAQNIGMPFKTAEQKAAARAEAKTWTAGQFVEYWRTKFYAGGTSSGGVAEASAASGEPIDFDAVVEPGLRRVDELADQARPGDAVYKDNAEAKFLTQVNRLKSAQNAQQSAALDRLLTAAIGGPDASGPQIFDIATLAKSYPDAQVDLRVIGGARQARLADHLRQEGNALTPERLAEYMDLKGQAANVETQQQFLNTDLTTRNLTLQQQKELGNLKISLQQKNARVLESNDNLRAAIRDPIIASAMKSNGLKFGTTRYNQFSGAMLGEIESFKAAHQGKNPNLQELRDIANNTLARSGGGFLGFGSTAGYEVPSDARNQIVQRYNNKFGRDPSEEQISEIYRLTQ